MKFSLILVTLLMVIINISIPSAFGELKVFTPEVEMTLADFMDKHSQDAESDCDNETSEAEEVEKEIFFSDFSNLHFGFQEMKANSSPLILVCSYIFSIFIPPLA